MKKFLLFATIALAAQFAFADFTDDGYYRVRNAYTQRYAYLLDDKGSIDYNSSSADVRALNLFKDSQRVLHDPSSVFYLKKAPSSNNQMDIAGQGTSVHGFLDMYVNYLAESKLYNGSKSYLIWGSLSGVAKYLGDTRSDNAREDGLASVDAKGDNRKWHILPLEGETEEYFGVLPTVSVGGKHYQPYYAGFPFSAKSEGMKFYVITNIDHRGVAVYEEVEGTVPAGTPVIIECLGTTPDANKLNIGGSGNSVAINLLKGVYFENDSRTHYNLTPFDRSTMRVLGVKNGKLTFVEGDYDFIPRNQAYLQLTDASQYNTPDFVLMTPDEYAVFVEENKDNSVSGVIAESAVVDVYGLDGRLLKAGMTKNSVSSLGKGIYILRSGDKSEKAVVK